MKFNIGFRNGVRDGLDNLPFPVELDFENPEYQKKYKLGRAYIWKLRGKRMAAEGIDYFHNGEYQRGRTDGFMDEMAELPNRNLDFRDEAYLLGYFDGRAWAKKHYIDKCADCSSLDDDNPEDIS